MVGSKSIFLVGSEGFLPRYRLEGEYGIRTPAALADWLAVCFEGYLLSAAPKPAQCSPSEQRGQARCSWREHLGLIVPDLPKPSVLTLGTASFGISYGIANPSGQPSPAAVDAMLDRAWEAGIRSFDTAPGYGEAEALLGRWIKRRRVMPHIVTKLPGLGRVSDLDAATAVDLALRTSIGRLGTNLATYLAHDALDYLRPVIRERLQMAVARGLIGVAGLSVYDGAEVYAAIKAGPPQAIQLPVSALDQRMVTGGALAACADVGITVFARSVFLQGALLMSPGRLPPMLQALRSPLTQFDALCAEMSSTPASLALRFVRDLPGIKSTIVGIYSAEQLATLVAAASEPPLTSDQRAAITAVAAGIPPLLLDPRTWQTKD